MEQQTIKAEENHEKSEKNVPYQLRTCQKIYLPFKRLIDIVGAFVGILFCLALLWWWVVPVNAIVTKGHPFFNRHRVGRNGKAFICLKLRTMKADTDPHLSSTTFLATSPVLASSLGFLRLTRPFSSSTSSSVKCHSSDLVR